MYLLWVCEREREQEREKAMRMDICVSRAWPAAVQLAVPVVTVDADTTSTCSMLAGSTLKQSLAAAHKDGQLSACGASIHPLPFSLP